MPYEVLIRRTIHAIKYDGRFEWQWQFENWRKRYNVRAVLKEITLNMPSFQGAFTNMKMCVNQVTWRVVDFYSNTCPIRSTTERYKITRHPRCLSRFRSLVGDSYINTCLNYCRGEFYSVTYLISAPDPRQFVIILHPWRLGVLDPQQLSVVNDCPMVYAKIYLPF